MHLIGSWIGELVSSLLYLNSLRFLLQMQTILDEIVFGGQVLETSSTEVIKAVEEISKYVSLNFGWCHNDFQKED